MNRLILISAMTLGLSASAHAADMPTYDPEGYCKRSANLGGFYSAAVFNHCIQMEQEGYDTLKPMWPTLDIKIDTYCRALSEMDDGGSYGTLFRCVERELEASGAKATFKP